ncbi:hypothetical protein C8J57DRAFT_1394887 [Mycena rebaudengoi]|nr:hypothetical protein C8J57DRAFT_1394887 [Mycena rebaudengoi]
MVMILLGLNLRLLWRVGPRTTPPNVSNVWVRLSPLSVHKNDQVSQQQPLMLRRDPIPELFDGFLRHSCKDIPANI